MANLFEALMIFCFGLSWPTSVINNYRSKTSKGKSPVFEILIWIGYAFGIARKIIQYNEYLAKGTTPEFLFFFAWFFYCFNMTMITLDLIIFVRNRKLDEQNK